ncbi:MAG: hypothetical protein FWG92_00880 [Leptospirales bacterium]|nr:hypothetical protein [Leptospirales bacterium]
MNRFVENITIWYFTDNESGRKTASAIKGLGLAVNLLETFNLTPVGYDDINIFIFDMTENPPREIIDYCASEKNFWGFAKLVMLSKKDLKEALLISFNIDRLEFLSKPVNTGEFLLLLEKVILLEYCRKNIPASELGAMNLLEGFLSIGRKDVFDYKNETDFFAYLRALHKKKTGTKKLLLNE